MPPRPLPPQSTTLQGSLPLFPIVSSLFSLISYILSEDRFQFFDHTGLQRVLVIAALTVDSVATAGTATTPLLPLVFIKFVTAEAADHVSSPVTNKALFNT